MHPATQYAIDVTEGRIVAGPHVRAACARHLADLERDDLQFDEAAADHVIAFFREVLCLNGGEYEGVPFEPLSWQLFVLGCLFGWKTMDGWRRFSTAYIETGKGSGKSPLVAGIGLYMAVADNEPRAEVYAAAVKQDQAKVLYRDAVAMVQMSPALADRVRLWGGADPHNMTYEGSFFRPISSEERGRGQSGPRPHCGILDEVHEHPTNAMVEMMSAGRKNRRQPLTIMITNSGNDRRSPCWGYHEYAAKVSSGEIQDDEFFGYVCALDEGDDPFSDESCWIKANPSMPAIPGEKYLRKQVREAKGMPSKEALVRRLNFCEWIEGVNPLFARDVWVSTLHPLALSDYEGRPCVAALDLSSRRDLTALALGFPDVNEAGEPTLDAFVFYWTPEDTLDERERKDRAPYTQWVRDGHLFSVPGNTIDYAWVASALVDITESHELSVMAFDRWKMSYLQTAMDDAGIEWHESSETRGYGLELREHGQGFRDMGPAIEKLEEYVLNGRMRIQSNPVTTMCASNCAIATDPAENRKFEKSKSTGRIDGMVALAMLARTAAQFKPESTGTIYDDMDLEFV